jgi:hypothetical protein
MNQRWGDGVRVVGLLWVMALCVPLVSVSAGCNGSDACGVEHDASTVPAPTPDAGMLRVEIGTPGGDDGLDFLPLEAGGDIALETFGQGGTHATVAVRAYGMGTNRAFIDVTVENIASGETVATVMTRAPSLWLCDDAREICDYLPIHVMTGGLADPTEKDGLAVRVSAVVRVETGISGEGSQDGVLRQAF